ncbi:MAG: CinA family nicotinamide mononucleotide deamidase-related protein [Planctomycetes bacterium]|nr:CinA family nicotinamide mononucleotide deamidase-related protein [Planctomycetota bacterium]
MRAEIIAIGDELTSGQRLDTNTQWLSERLGELGVTVAFHTTVGDDLETNVAAFRTAFDRADIVVSTGGLGPTADDLTRDALAAAAGVELVQDGAALEHIRDLFARRRREMPEQNVRQAQFPRGSRAVPNSHGTAPGIDFTVPRPSPSPPQIGEGLAEGACRVFALPGVPAEMFEMWEASVAPAIAAALGSRRVIRHRRIKVFGAGESDVEAMLPDMIRRKREPLVGITVSGATITLRITASGPNDAACEQAMAPTIAQIREILGVLVFGEEDDELEHAVVRLLNERKQSMAVAEWATDGLVSQWLAEAASGSGCFRGGIVVRDAAMLCTLLDVAVEASDGANERTASAMAQAVREKSGAVYGLAIAALPASGPAESTAATDPHGVEFSGTLHIALATSDNVRVKGFPLASHPAITKPRSAKQALNMLRLTMLNG